MSSSRKNKGKATSVSSGEIANPEQIFTFNFRGSESCEDICKENWHDWSEWSDCPICGRNATQQRYRACDGSGYVSEVIPGPGIKSKNQSRNHTLLIKFNIFRCSEKSEIEKRLCAIPDCHDGNGCRVNTQLRNFTQSGCQVQNVVVNYCAGRCDSSTRILAEYPYVKSVCECCSYNLDPNEPVKEISMNCPGYKKPEFEII